MANEANGVTRPPGRRPWRRLAFRLAAILLGLALLGAAEGIFRLLDWGRPEYRDDPFVGFSAVRPLFVRTADGSRYEIAPSRRAFFRPASFPAAKPPGACRIFCLGGSTVQGRPFAVETSFTTWLQIDLEAADPGRPWEVINCGGISYASYRLVPILEEVLRYEPDLVILYTGHNEFLEDRQYGRVRDLPRAVAWPWELALQTRTYNLLRAGYEGLAGPPPAPDDRPVLGPETDAMLDWQGGFDRYRRDPQLRENVIRHFRCNLERMVQIARDAGVPLILANPVANLRDCPPFKSQHRDGLGPEDLARWQTLCREAGDALAADPRRAADLLQRALAIDDQFAHTWYLLGRTCDTLAAPDRARQAYLRAKDLDVCPLRILEPMNQAVLDVARRTGTPLVDVRKLVEAESRDGIPGGYFLLDHVHPSIAGHQRIADALLDELVRQRIVRPRDGWQADRDRKAREHLAALGDFYFARGRQRLEALRLWTQGRVDRVRPDSGAPHGAPAADGSPAAEASRAADTP